MREQLTTKFVLVREKDPLQCLSKSVGQAKKSLKIASPQLSGISC